MKNLLFILLPLVFPAALMAEGNTESGPMTSKSYSLSGFSEISNHTSADLVIEIGRNFEILAEGDSRFIDSLDPTVNGDTLVLKTRPGNWNFSFNSRQKITVILPQLTGLKLTGSGNGRVVDPVKSRDFTLKVTGSGDAELIAEVENMEVTQTGSGNVTLQGSFQNVDLRITGSGDMNLTGFSDSLKSVQNGSGNIRGERFKVKSADITQTGSGDSEMEVSDSLDLRITGSGNFRYRGNPQIGSITMTGSGNMRNLN